MAGFANIAVPLGVRKTFSYSIPARFRDRIAVGMRVLVPFGRKLLTGYVVGTSDNAPEGGFKLRAVHELLESEPLISASLIETALWIADYYFAPPGEVFRALFPAGTQVSGAQKVFLSPKAAALISGGLKPAGLRPQEEILLEILAHEGPMTAKQLEDRCAIHGAGAWIDALAADHWIRAEVLLNRPRVVAKEQLGIRVCPVDEKIITKLTQAQKRLYSALQPGDEPVPLQETLQYAESTLAVARALEKKGAVIIAPLKIERRPADLSETTNEGAPVLTSSQQDLVDGLLKIILQEKAARCLIHGVTGSGKTEIYLRLISEVLKLGGTALLLVPEIGLTPMLSRLVVSRFPNQVSVLHSGMSPGERFDQWNQIREGKTRVVVGTRSAVFAPLDKLRLVVIDEEQDASYKQDESPCYHAREVAWHRMKQMNGILLLGSATPSVETFYSAVQSGEMDCFSLPERIEARPLPEVKIVDMGVEFQRHGKNTIMSTALQEELQNCIRRGEQAIILLNRRGYSRRLMCRSCGNTVVCPDCSISMTYHMQENRLICHYCGRENSPPSACTECGGSYIYYTGVGTEQLEGILRSLLPDARIARFDRDSTRRRGTLRKILFDFAGRKLDILAGTQMLAKGHDFPNVTLVGVVAADSGLSFPDFRCAERTFQMLIQVAGRAGRGTAPGRVVIQSFHPDNYVLRFAQKQDYHSFFRQEIEYRELMGYPPFRSLIQILISEHDETKAMHTASKIAEALKIYAGESSRSSRPLILGPAAAPIEKLRGNYRIQILIKLPAGASGIGLLNKVFDDLTRRKISFKNVRVDVDPLSLM